MALVTRELVSGPALGTGQIRRCWRNTVYVPRGSG